MTRKKWNNFSEGGESSVILQHTCGTVTGEKGLPDPSSLPTTSSLTVLLFSFTWDRLNKLTGTQYAI